MRILEMVVVVLRGVVLDEERDVVIVVAVVEELDVELGSELGELGSELGKVIEVTGR